MLEGSRSETVTSLIRDGNGCILMVPPAGIEPATLGLVDRNSAQLNYGSVMQNCMKLS
jgi:hypothetical protein